jgi:hypothetical protein
MSSSLVQVQVQIAKGASVNTPTGAAFASTSVVVTDPVSGAQTPVVLTGVESPPWSFTTSVNPGTGSVVATDLDVNGAVLGSISQSFTEAGSPPTFSPSASITVTPVVVAASAAAKKA